MAPTIRKGSAPVATASGSAASGGSWDRSSWQAKNLTNDREVADDGSPAVSGIGRRVHLPAGGAEIHAARIERVDRHRIAQYVHVAVALRQAVRERLPLVSARAAAVHAQLSLGWIVLGVALDGDDVDGLRLVRVHVDREPEVARQIPAHLLPRYAGVVAAHDVP